MIGARNAAACRLRPVKAALESAPKLRPLVYGAVALCLAQSAMAQSGRATVETVLRKSVASQRGVNLRGMQTVTRRMVRRADGRSLAIVVDTSGRTGAIYQDDGKWTRTYDPATRTCTISRSPSRIVDEKSIERAVRRILSNYSVKLQGME